MIFLSFRPPSNNFWTLDVGFRASYRAIVVLLVSDRNCFDCLIAATASAAQAAAARWEAERTVAIKKEKELPPHTHTHSPTDRQMDIEHSARHTVHMKISIYMYNLQFHFAKHRTYAFSMRFDFSYFCLDGNSEGMFVCKYKHFSISIFTICFSLLFRLCRCLYIVFLFVLSFFSFFLSLVLLLLLLLFHFYSLLLCAECGALWVTRTAATTPPAAAAAAEYYCFAAFFTNVK